MKTILDLDTWNRKDHFLFFNGFEEPFFGIVADLDVSIAYQQAKAAGVSFFLYYLHKSLAAANQIKPFRYRIEDAKVVVYDRVDASPTIQRPDGTFGFSYMDFHPDFEIFRREAQKEIDRVQNTSGLELAGARNNVIHVSSLPWIRFTSISHARSFSFKDSCPKISFGKMTEEDGKKIMPVSIHVNHSLADGADVGAFFNLFQDLMNELL